MQAQFVFENLNILQPKSDEEVESQAKDMDPEELLDDAIMNDNERLTKIALENGAELTSQVYYGFRRKINLVDYVPNSIDAIRFVNNKIFFPDWDVFIDYTSKDGNEFVSDIIQGDGYRHIDYYDGDESLSGNMVEYELDRNSALSWEILELINNTLKSEFDSVGEAFSFLDESDNSYHEEVKNAIKRAISNVYDSKAEDLYFKQIKNEIQNRFGISNVKWNQTLKEYEANITDEGKVELWAASEYVDEAKADAIAMARNVDPDFGKDDFGFLLDELKTQIHEI